MQHPWDNSTIFYQQDKEVGINPDFDEAEAGNPLCHACGTEEMKKQRGRPVKIGTEKHIRITDSDLTDKINLLMKIPGYGTADSCRKNWRRCGYAGRAGGIDDAAKKRKPRGKVLCRCRTAAARSGAERDHQQVNPLVAV